MISISKHQKQLIIAMILMTIISLIISLLTIDYIVSISERENAENRVLRISEELDSRRPSLGALAPIDEIDRRIKLQNNDGSFYSVRRKDGRIITGNIAQWPMEKNDNIVFNTIINGEKSVAIIKESGTDFEILIAQSVKTQIKIRQKIISLLIAVLSINFLSGYILIRRANAKSDHLLNSLSNALDHASIDSVNNKMPQYTDPLYYHIAERINALLSKIENSQDVLRQLGGNMAHELIEPLTKIQDQIDSLAEKHNDIPEFEMILEELDDVRETYRGLLSLAEIEAGQQHVYNFQSFDLSDAARDACNLYEENIKDAGLKLTIKFQTVNIFGDPWLIRSAIGNIISNAIRHSPHGGRITVITERVGTVGKITIDDEGPGIGGRTAAQLFNDIRNRKNEGMMKHGLGLRIVNSIAIRHNAKLSFEEANLGLSVCIEFPCA